MSEATRRRLESFAPSKKTREASRPKESPRRQAETTAVDDQSAAEQVTGKRLIEGALDVTPLPKRPRGPNEGAAILIPGDEDEQGSEPVNIACPSKVVGAVNNFIYGAQMELSELEQLPKKTLREQAGRAFRVQTAAHMEMWLGMKRALNAGRS